jgi:bis(5'-adenosyl)-triphosphatase
MTKEIFFFKYLVTPQVFYCSKHTYALVNIKPLVPGHVLIVPYRQTIVRFSDLTPEESIDYMNTLQLIHQVITKAYKADSLNIAIQDGPESGQSVPHLHTHIIPRYKLDSWGDNLYQQLEKTDLNPIYQDFFARKQSFQNNPIDSLSIPDLQRVNRTPEIMETEANWLRQQVEIFLSSI